MRGPRPPHGLRGGPLPEHRRVLEPRHRHLHDPGRRLHARLRLLRGQDGAARRARPTRRSRARVADAVARMGLRHAVITSVNRDDQQDGGAAVFAACIREIRARVPGCAVEVLIPDFKGDWDALDSRARRPPRHPQPQHRDGAAPLPARCGPGARFERSLELLRRSKARGPADQERHHGRPGRGVGRGRGDDPRDPRRGHRHPDRRPVPAAQRRSTCPCCATTRREEFDELKRLRARPGLPPRGVGPAGALVATTRTSRCPAAP